MFSSSLSSFTRQTAIRQLFVFLLSLSLMFALVAAQDEDEFGYPINKNTDNNNDASEQRLQEKPWSMRNIHVAGITLPFSPVTLFVVYFSVCFLYSALWGSSHSKTYAIASHILMDDKKILEQYKAKIGNNAKLFAKYAKEHSTCPSKQQGGSLGRFKKGVMAPPFDKAVFDPATVVETTIGPIQTQFGWHLIYVHERVIAK
jgi:peptidyl-prolyl cis-trans isomerase C